MNKLAAVKNHFELIAITNKKLNITVTSVASLGICVEGDYALISNENDSYCLAYEHDGVMMLEMVTNFCPEVEEFSSSFKLAAKAEEFILSVSKPNSAPLTCPCCGEVVTPKFDCSCFEEE